jgi:hypothetical protein
MKEKGMMTYYGNMLKVANTAPHFPSFKYGDGIQKLLASMIDDRALRQ